MRLFSERDDDVNRQCGDDHGLALARADLRDQRPDLLRGRHGGALQRRARGGAGVLEKPPERQQADHLCVVREHQQVESALHGHCPLVEDLPEDAQAIALPRARRLPQLLEHAADVRAAEKIAVCRELDQLSAGRIVLLDCPQILRDVRVQPLRLRAELHVRLPQILALRVLEEEQHRFHMRQQGPQILWRSLFILDEGQDPRKEHGAVAFPAVDEPQANVKVREVEKPELWPRDHLPDDLLVHRIGMRHGAGLPRQQHIARLFHGLRVAPAQVHLGKLGLLQGSEQALALLRHRTETARHSLDLSQDVLPHVVDAPPRDQPFLGELEHSLDHALALPETVRQHIRSPLPQLLFEEGEVAELHRGLQRG
mmetsp:Transcript_26768/g.80684  ORF Transcript_26768/g.80684 Transcript_26768/m.80684 type:complete len:369 (+) Transcript_26768:1247-2353(+)